MTLRVKVDLDLCQGHGVCESEAPEVFEVGKNPKVHVLNETPDEDLLAGVRLAIKYCPTHALSLVED
ncbi:MAG TPA: ferredoxin [Microthrixaceae bacterium]|nr:ferredoxin [Microthrixaceae bacterium]